MCVCVCVCVCVYPNSPPGTGCDTRSIFKRSLTGFNSFPFRRPVDVPKLKGLVCPSIYQLLEGE